MSNLEIFNRFPTRRDCITHLEKVMWNGKPKCPYCKSLTNTKEKNINRYHCNKCNTGFSVTVGTIFHKTKLDLRKWVIAISLVLNSKKGITSRQLAKDIEVTKDTAWLVLAKIRDAMKKSRGLLEKIVETDEFHKGRS